MKLLPIVGVFFVSTAVLAGPQTENGDNSESSSSLIGCVKAERDLLKTLRKPFRLQSGTRTLNEFAEQIADATGLSVELDELVLNDVGIGTDHPINVVKSQFSLRTHLNHHLGRIPGLGWTTNRGTLVITSAMTAEDTLITRVYDISDLVEKESSPAPKPGASGFFQFGGSSDGAGYVSPSPLPTAEYNTDPIVDAMTSSTASETWEQAGGPGVITPLIVKDRVLLVISQTEAVHFEVERLLFLIRDALRKPEDPTAENEAPIGEE